MKLIKISNREPAVQLPTELLKTFVAVADSGSFTLAARSVHRSQSAVSMQIKRLEEELGHPLLDRRNRSLRLTSEGETLLTYARRILSLHEEAVAAVARPDLAGRVRIGASEDHAALFLPQILAHFSAEYPRVQVEMLCQPGLQLQATLSRGELDLLIRTGAENAEDGEVIHWEPVVWVTSRRHCVYESDPVPLALYNEECTFRKWALKALQTDGRNFRIAYTSPSIAGIMAAVSAGLAVAPVGLSMLRGKTRVLGAEDGFPALPTAPVTLHLAPGRASKVVEALAGHVREAFRGRIL